MIPALAVVLASFVVVYASAGGHATVNIKADAGRWVFPIEENHLETVFGPLGPTVIKIRDGAARVVSSPCPDQVCVAVGEIWRPGQWAACLPNRVMLYVEGGENGGDENGNVDATAR